MAAKKTSKKRVSVELDIDDLIALLDAAEALVEVVSFKILHHKDPGVRRAVAKKRAKKGARRRRR
jgi:hypothetical protein